MLKTLKPSIKIPYSDCHNNGKGGICMKGGIYTRQKCSICGTTFKDNHRNGLSCPSHPQQLSTKFIVKFDSVFKNFPSYNEAQRFLTGLRFKTDEGSFDSRDYKQDMPLSFKNLAEKWLEHKLNGSNAVKHKSYKNLKNYINQAIEEWGNRNIKTIGFAEFEDFFYKQGKRVSGKTVHNMKSCLHSFWMWLRKRKVITLAQFPEFPEVKYKLKYRDIVEKDQQINILDEIKRLTFQQNPKIWIGIKWLCTYISIRPGELIKIKEGDIDTSNGYIFIKDHKTDGEGAIKSVPLLDEDIQIIRTMPKGLPHVPFFRHTKGISGCRSGQQFGEKYFYKWWMKACENLGIEGVDLYGGTRHSSAVALRKHHTPEEIKRGTMHTSNKAFERYYRLEGDDLRSIYANATPERDNTTSLQPLRVSVPKKLN